MSRRLTNEQREARWAAKREKAAKEQAERIAGHTECCNQMACPSAFQAMQDAREPLSYEDHSSFTHQLLGWFLGAIDTKGVLTKEDAMRAISQVRDSFRPAGSTTSHAEEAGRPS